MEMLIQIDEQPVTVYQPDGLALEKMQFRPRPGNTDFWEAPHPTKADCQLRLVKHDNDGHLHLMEVGRIRIDSTKDYWSTQALTVFRGWTYTKEHFTQLLELLRWTPAAQRAP